VHCFSVQVVINKCFLLNPEKNLAQIRLVVSVFFAFETILKKLAMKNVFLYFAKSENIRPKLTSISQSSLQITEELTVLVLVLKVSNTS